MGIQEPLTEHALGRSPYDDVVTGEGKGEKAQKYDNRGRPINPETKRINHEIVRAHNEVMLVIGVAETKSHHGGDLEPQGRHAAHEETIGLFLASPAKRCIESAGIFGIHGLRQRILIYKRYSHIPFWDLLKKSRKESFLTQNILAGAPTSLITNYIDLFLKRRYPDERGTPLRHIAHYAWIFFDLHLELYVALQRLGLIPNLLMTPSLKFFVPFTEISPVPAPAAPIGFSASSLLRWLGAAIVSAAPFIAWSLATRLIYNAKPKIWSSFFERLPSTIFQAKTTSQALSSRLLRSSTISEFHHEAIQEASQQQNLDGHDTFRQPGGSHPQEMDSGDLTDRTGSWAAVAESASAGYTADEYTSSEDDSEVVSATLISFDVEAAEPADVSPGLWSAELRPSAVQDSKSGAGQSVLYCDTLLTQLPALIGSHVFTDSLSRLLFIPSEAVVLRLIAWSLRQRQGLACEDILPVRLFGGVTWPYALNLAATEFFHLAVCSVMWAGFSALSVRYHRTEEEWLADEARTLERKSG